MGVGSQCWWYGLSYHTKDRKEVTEVTDRVARFTVAFGTVPMSASKSSHVVVWLAFCLMILFVFPNCLLYWGTSLLVAYPSLWNFLATISYSYFFSDVKLVQVKRRKFIPRSTSPPFFRVRPWKFAHVFYEPLRHLTYVTFFYFFAWFFVSKYCLGNWSILDLFRPNIFGEKNEKNGDQASGGTYRTRVQNVMANLSKTAWTLVL